MKTRVISAVVALLIVIPLIYFGGSIFAFGVGVISLLAYKELLDLKKFHNEIPNFVKILGMLSLLYLILGNYEKATLSGALSYSKLLIPLIFLLLPVIFYKKEKYQAKDAFNLIGFIYLIGLVFNLLIIIRNMDINLLIYLISITILTDTFAYLIGRLIGKHKICPSISPNKSWEGAIGGLIGGATISVILYAALLGEINLKIILITIILSVVSQMGDFVFSKIKRENDIKDFSNIMPGHGGILDRIDSLTFVLMTYVILISI